MARKTNKTINGIEYYRIKRKTGRMRLNRRGDWVPEYKDYYGKSKKDAEEKHQARMRALNNESRCFGEEVGRFIAEVFLQSDLKDGTKRLYVNAYNKNLKNKAIMGKNLSDIKPIDLQTEYNNMTCGVTSIKQVHKLMVNFFNYASMNGFCNNIASNKFAFKRVKTSSGSKGIKVFTREEIKRILDGTTDSKHYFLFVFLIFTGCRIREALAVRYDDIDLKNKTITINKQVGYTLDIEEPKTESSNRILSLEKRVLQSLKEHKARHEEEMREKGYSTEYVFTTTTGNFYDYGNLHREVKPLLEALGITFEGFHAFRHTFATLLAEEGTNIEVVSKLLGHSNIQSTAKYYVGVSDARKKKAISMLNNLW